MALALALPQREPGSLDSSSESTSDSSSVHPRLASAIVRAAGSRTLHCAFSRLERLPGALVAHVSGLVRLDVSHNLLRALPREVGLLSSLEELWVNSNPLQRLPEELSKCSRLSVVDARATQLSTVPTALGELASLVCVDLRGVTTLDAAVREATRIDEEPAPSPRSQTAGLVLHLKRLGDVGKLTRALSAKLSEGIYRQASESEEGAARIARLVAEAASEFQDLDELKGVLRHCDRLFPERVQRADVPAVKRKLRELKRQNERKKLAAKLELKLRRLYFDRIDPAIVEGIVRDIYKEISSLDDIVFLIKNAARILPASAADIQGPHVRESLVQLQQLLAEERAAAEALVAKSVAHVYPHVEPAQVRELTAAVCAFFPTVDTLKALSADTTHFFPAEFETAFSDPRSIRRAFLRASSPDE